MSLPAKGPPEWVALYYDPIIDHIQKGGARIGVAVALYLAPQRPAVARRLFDWAADDFGWRDSGRSLFAPPGDPRLIALGLALATEFGDSAVLARLRAYAEERLEPTWDRARGEFWYGFGLNEPLPRGQPNATIMMAEAGSEGAWWRIFNQPNLQKFSQPVVSGVEYPTLGIAQAYYDPGHGRLAVATYAADPATSGRPTRFRVEQLPSAERCRVERDGAPYNRWRRSGPASIELEVEAAEHAYLIAGGSP
jgi:hypothetical protein